MRGTSPVSLFAAALSLYLAAFAHAGPSSPDGNAIKQLSDQNLFEAHLHQTISATKRLPKKIGTHRLNQREEAAPSTAGPASVALSSSLSEFEATSTFTSEVAGVTFSPKQPSHLINRHHRKSSLGKRRLSADGDQLPWAQIQFERDSENFSVLADLHTLMSGMFSWTNEAQPVASTIEEDTSSESLTPEVDTIVQQPTSLSSP